MTKLAIRRKPEVEEKPTERDCPECGTTLVLQRQDLCFFYQCKCSVVSYRYAKAGDCMDDFPNYYAHVCVK